MPISLKVLAWPLVLTLFSAGSVCGQVMHDSVLADVDSVNAHVFLTWDDRLPSREEEVRSRLQTVFELELRKAGVPVTENALGFLAVELVLLRNPSGIVAFAYRHELYERGLSTADVWSTLARAVSLAIDSVGGEQETVALNMVSIAWDAATTELTGPNPWLITWKGPAGVVTVGESNLRESLEQVVAESAQSFANAWLSVH